MKRILALAFILALAGGYWFMQNRDRFFPKPVATEVAPQRWQVSTNQQTPGNADQGQLNATMAAAGSNATEANATWKATPHCPAIRPTRSCAMTSWRT
jgi:hypothetical protein